MTRRGTYERPGGSEHLPRRESPYTDEDGDHLASEDVDPAREEGAHIVGGGDRVGGNVGRHCVAASARNLARNERGTNCFRSPKQQRTRTPRLVLLAIPSTCQSIATASAPSESEGKEGGTHDIERLPEHLAIDDKGAVRSDGAEQGASAPQGRDEEDLSRRRGLLLAVPTKVADIARESRPGPCARASVSKLGARERRRTHAGGDGGHERVPGVESLERRSSTQDRSSLITSFVDRPRHHPQSNDGKRDGFDEEEETEVPRVDEAEGKLDPARVSAE